jgi:hypothetical protein
MKNIHLNFFLIISILKQIYSDKSMTIYLALDSEIKNVINNEKEFEISSYSQKELSDINLIKKFTFSYESKTNFSIISSLENSTLAAFIIDNDSSDSFYFSSTSNWKCNGTELKFISLVRDSIWDKNKKIPPLASIIQCINGTNFTFNVQNE